MLKANAITTPQRAADFIGMGTLSGVNATKFERLVNSVTDFIENYIGYRVKKTTYTHEEYNSNGGNTICLKSLPVLESENFDLQKRTSGDNDDSWESIDGDDFHVDWETGIIYGAGGRRFNRGHKNYRVTYTAGYDYDNSATFLSDTDGADIEMAAWLLIASIEQRSDGGAGVVSESIGDYRIQYAKSMFKNEDIEDLLSNYKKADTIGFVTPTNW